MALRRGMVTLALACGLVAGCSSASSKPSSPPPAVPGVSAGSAGAAGAAGTIVIGGFAPGGAANPWSAGALAYFRWLNAHGGVLGRSITYKVLDDQAGPAIVPALAHRLVQQDVVFTLFGAQGTTENLSVASYLSQSGVPDLFADSACGCLNSPATYPEVFGWPLAAAREGKILGAFAKQRFTGQKVGVLYSPDEPGQDGLAGFLGGSRGLPLAGKVAVGGASALPGALAKLKAAGASVVVAFTPADVTDALGPALTAARYQPRLLVAGGAGSSPGSLPAGTFTDSFLPQAGLPARSAGASWLALFQKIGEKYLPRVPLSSQVTSGMAAAYELASALVRAGSAPTRQSLMSALAGLPQGPAMAPISFTATDHGGVSGAYIGVVRGGTLVPLTGSMVTDNMSAGPVTAYQYPQPSAPATGVPTQ